MKIASFQLQLVNLTTWLLRFGPPSCWFRAIMLAVCSHGDHMQLDAACFSGSSGLPEYCLHGLQQLTEAIIALVFETEEDGASELSLHQRPLRQAGHLNDEAAYLAMQVLQALAQCTRSLLEVLLACPVFLNANVHGSGARHGFCPIPKCMMQLFLFGLSLRLMFPACTVIM
jgi:hypothetical protein